MSLRWNDRMIDHNHPWTNTTKTGLNNIGHFYLVDLERHHIIYIAC